MKTQRSPSAVLTSTQQKADAPEHQEAKQQRGEPSDCDHFVFADRDMRPGPDTEAFLEAEGKLVACKYDVFNKETWVDPHAMHCGLWRCDREVLEAIEPPWFQRILTEDGGHEKACVCIYFRDKARKAGFEVVRAGWCDHELGPRIH